MTYEEEREAYRLIDEYLDEVRRYLPDDIADDVIEELRTHIIDKANEMGGITVKNVYSIIKSLGEPRKLASEYVIGGERKKLRFELGISEDLYPIFTKIVFWTSVLIILGYIVRMVQYAFGSYNTEISIAKIAMTFSEMIVALVLTVTFLYIAMSFISSNPDIKREFIKAFKEFFGEPIEREEKRREKARKIKIKEEKRPIAGLYLLSAVITIIVAYVIYLSTLELNYTWLMKFLCYTLVIELAISSAINIIAYFYISYKGESSFLIEISKKLIQFILIPWLLIANIFTEDIQIPLFKEEFFDNPSFKGIVLIKIPAEYIPLAKLLTILLIVVLIVDSIIAYLKYVRTMPKEKTIEE